MSILMKVAIGLGIAAATGAVAYGVNAQIQQRRNTSRPTTPTSIPPTAAVSAVSGDFIARHSAITRTVPYDHGWANGTDYFDPAVDADLGLQVGELAASVDSHGRRMIFVGIPHARNIVLFERYSEPNSRICCNWPISYNILFNNIAGSLSETDVEFLLGTARSGGQSNLAVRLRGFQVAMEREAMEREQVFG